MGKGSRRQLIVLFAACSTQPAPACPASLGGPGSVHRPCRPWRHLPPDLGGWTGECRGGVPLSLLPIRRLNRAAGSSLDFLGGRGLLPPIPLCLGGPVEPIGGLGSGLLDSEGAVYPPLLFTIP
ncbi:hypothetical protein NDU88_001982 [Pleurodeles waltl]|uniref:Secreted protein n=1 Tax=Pleurodeles waltl TaxID=8319 RepID=A0AAV7WM74_PLEWA|nr:hypothetical protein NDU88_001982 [Pleurodeles waltl]